LSIGIVFDKNMKVLYTLQLAYVEILYCESYIQ